MATEDNPYGALETEGARRTSICLVAITAMFWLLVAAIIAWTLAALWAVVVAVVGGIALIVGGPA